MKTRNDFLSMKNRMTGKAEVIIQSEIEMLDWGFHFFVATELEAYKAAYQYRYVPHGVKIEYAAGAEMWMVTVFNERAKTIGCDGAK